MRPLLETGHQAVLLMCLIDRGLENETIELNFPDLCADLLQEMGRSTDELVHLFGLARDTWIERNVDDWLGRHGFYPEVIETFARRIETDPVFILTTKQERFVRTLLNSREIPLPDGHIFGLHDGKSKEDVLEELSGRAEFVSAHFHFVEDRLQTLIRVAETESLRHINLYLADWGYNTPEERGKARANPRITIWQRGSFLNV